MRSSRQRWGSVVGLALLVGCGPPPPPSPPHREAAGAPATADPPAASDEAPSSPRGDTEVVTTDHSVAAPPAPITEHGPRGQTELALDGFLPALISWPDTNRWPQPVLVAAHGAGNSAESQCELWRELLGARGVILCPRGRAIHKGSPQHGYYYPDHLSLERELVAALAALGQRHAELADAERLVYAGYSQGAQMGLLMLLGRGALVPRLLLVEGGSGDWTDKRAAQFAKSGGERVALVCGTPGCHANAQRSAGHLQAAGVQVSVHHVPGGGHAYWGPVALECARAFGELTQGDPRWEG